MELREIRQLLKLLDENNIAEFELKRDAFEVRIVRPVCPPSVVTMAAPTVQPVMAAPPPVVKSEPEAPPARPANVVAVTSPMVGTFYRSVAPDAPPFVKEGDMVEKGQPLCIIEAMKLMNEIESDVSGRVYRALKENASLVEYGEELFLIEQV